jgi:DNA-binding response OmpR family regulator
MGNPVCILSENPISSAQLAKKLSAMGVDVVNHTKIDVCLAEHQKSPFGLILLDRLQGNNNSKEWLKRIRDEQFDLPVLLLLSISEESHLNDYLRLGVSECLYKPVVDAALYLRLRHFLNGIIPSQKFSLLGGLKSAA